MPTDYLPEIRPERPAWNKGRIIGALLHKSAEGQRFPLPSQTYPVTSGMGVPCAVKLFKTALRT